FDLIPESPGFSPDGESVWFSAAVGGDTHLFRIPPGGKVQQVTPAMAERARSSFSLSAAHDRVAFVASDSTHPSEAYAARIASETLREEKKLSSLNDALLSRVALRPAERLRFPSDDGTTIEGWAVMPLGYDKARGPYPLIVSIHGGPHGA